MQERVGNGTRPLSATFVVERGITTVDGRALIQLLVCQRSNRRLEHIDVTYGALRADPQSEKRGLASSVAQLLKPSVNTRFIYV